MRSTLKQIAEATGYSIATVSRALNGSSKITAETKRAVLAQARRCGYRIECRSVALIVPHFQFDGYFGGVLRLLAAELSRQCFTIEVISSENLGCLRNTRSAERSRSWRRTDWNATGETGMRYRWSASIPARVISTESIRPLER